MYSSNDRDIVRGKSSSNNISKKTVKSIMVIVVEQ